MEVSWPHSVFISAFRKESQVQLELFSGKLDTCFYSWVFLLSTVAQFTMIIPHYQLNCLEKVATQLTPLRLIKMFSKFLAKMDTTLQKP